MSAAQWSPFTRYQIGDIVSYGIDTWLCGSANSGIAPTANTPFWTIISGGGGGGVGPTGPAGGLTNPLTSDLDCGGYEVQNSAVVKTDNLALDGASLATRITVQNAFDIVDAVNATRFQSVAPQCAVSPTGADDLCNKAYVDSVGGSTGPTGPAGPLGIGSFTYSATAPHGVNDWYQNAPTNWAFSNTGSQSNQDWLLALESAVQSLLPIYLTLVQGANNQTVLVTSVTPDVNYTYVEYQSAVIPPSWADTVLTSCYYSLAGNDGVTGAMGETGPTGPTGPFSQALANKIMVSPPPTPLGGVVNLTWSTGDPASQYVPLYPSTTTTTLAPDDPSTTGTGWRFNKTYDALNVSSASNPLVNGATYTILSQGNAVLNWNAMGAPVSHPNGTQFTYNGAVVVGGLVTPGTAYASTKISWYALNALYPFLSPSNTLPTSIVPSTAIKKKNLRNVWFLVKMNADLALQGSFAIQIETYAYQFGGNTTNDYTGRWAYSLPLQQGLGFSANSTTNITTAGTGLLTPRLRAGFTYLLYAGDITPAIIPNNGATFAQGGSGLFAPSQVSTENTLRDPYDIYNTYPHLGLTSSSYVANATQPAYGGSSPYTDQADVEVASIYLNTSSTSPPVGVGQTTMDFNVMAFGYSGFVDSAGSEQSFFFTTGWV